MKYLIPFITAGVGFVIGLLVCRRKKDDSGKVPISEIDLIQIYEQGRNDERDKVEREKTIERIKKRLGL